MYVPFSLYLCAISKTRFGKCQKRHQLLALNEAKVLLPGAIASLQEKIVQAPVKPQTFIAFMFVSCVQQRSCFHLSLFFVSSVKQNL